MLTWAPAAIGAAPVQKTIRVMNNGCAAAQLTWAIVDLPDPERPLQATAAVDDYGKVRLAVGPNPSPSPSPSPNLSPNSLALTPDP